MNIVDILDLIKEKIEAIDSLDEKYLESNGTKNGFEKLFPIIADEVKESLDTVHNFTYEVYSGKRFPDVDLSFNGKKYGLELKSRKNGSWTIPGNSVFESITGNDYEDIFLMFASQVKNENKYMIKHAPYWQAVSNIKVTHSPRFTIDMESLDISVFESKEEYDELRTKNEKEKISFLQEYLKENTAGVKWYTDSNENLNVTNFSELTTQKQNKLLAEIFVLFPDDLLIGHSKTKYLRSSKYLIETHFVYSSSFRDSLTAGGKITIHGVKFPRIIDKLRSTSQLILEVLSEASPDFIELAKDSWKTNLPINLISDNMQTSYMNILNYIGTSEDIPTDAEGSYKELLERANIPFLAELIFAPN